MWHYYQVPKWTAGWIQSNPKWKQNVKETKNSILKFIQNYLTKGHKPSGEVMRLQHAKWPNT
jgi:hypothetical protein